MTTASGAVSVQQILDDLFAHDDILGAVAASSDGLVLGTAGVPEDQAAMAAALASPLASVAQRTIERLNAGEPGLLSIAGGDGFIHVLGIGDLILVVLTEPCDSRVIAGCCRVAMAQLTGVLAPA